ncbi:MAG: hypothetical protein ACPGSC_02645 [Granulosicoccaceae bacterium]
MFEKLSTTALALTLLSASVSLQAAEPPPAQLGISPPRIDLELDRPVKNQSITIYNYSDKAKTIDLELINVSSIPGGKTIAPGPQTLSRWTLFNPKRFTVEPGKSQTVRMSIRPRTKLQSGKRYGILSIRQDMEGQGNTTQAKDGELTVSIGSSYGLPVIVDVR